MRSELVPGRQLAHLCRLQRPPTWQVPIYDLRTGNRSIVPGSQDLNGVQGVAEDGLVAASRGHTSFWYLI